MYEKRPVIENKLLSGRQVLASEPTPSDTSDSDSEYLSIPDGAHLYPIKNVTMDQWSVLQLWLSPHLIVLLHIH